MIKSLIFLLFCLVFTISAVAQTPAEKQEVLKPVLQLFDAMEKGDSLRARDAFAPSVSVVVLSEADGKPISRVLKSINGFVKSIGTPHPDVWHELIWDEHVQIDKTLAQVWAPYVFYLGNQFSHCGVDAFQLAQNEKGQWKIVHLAYTMRKTECNIPESIKKKLAH